MNDASVAHARLYRWLFRLGKRKRLANIDVRVMPPLLVNHAIIFEVIEAALNCVALHAPIRYDELRRDAPRILVTAIVGQAQYNAPLRMCILDGAYVESTNTTPERLAVTLIHEGMHARLERRGIAYSVQRRARIERICARAELAFARRLSGGDSLVQEARARAALPDRAWSDEGFRQREDAILLQAGWIGRLALKVRQRRS